MQTITGSSKSTTENLIALANEMLEKNGFAPDGSKKSIKKSGQNFFEKRFIFTPMGNDRKRRSSRK